MSNSNWFDKWALDYGDAFGFGDKQTKTVMAWGTVFTKLFTQSELEEAKFDLLASKNEIGYVDKHRTAIMNAVEAIRYRHRMQAARDAFNSQDGYRVCAICLGRGIQIVPHPELDDNDRPNKALLYPSEQPRSKLNSTLAVHCRCDVGRRQLEENKTREYAVLGIEDYELRYPDWQAVDAAREDVRRAMRRSPTEADTASLNAMLADARNRN